MHTAETIAWQLARSFVDGAWEADELVERGRSVLGFHYRWLRNLAARLVQAFPGRERPRRQQVEQFMMYDAGFRKACHGYQLKLQLFFEHRPEMWPSAGTRDPWAVPAIRTAGELADWLSVSTGQLDWFADRQGRQQHYPAGTLTALSLPLVRQARRGIGPTDRSTQMAAQDHPTEDLAWHSGCDTAA